MFSARTPGSLTVNALTARVEALRAGGATWCDLTGSNPGHAGLGLPPADVLAPLHDPRVCSYEPHPMGARAVRDVVSRDYYGGVVSPDELLLTASTSEGYGWVFKLLCNPGDRVLVPRPSYPLFEFLAALEGVAVDTYPLDYDGAWHLDAARLAERVTDRTRAVVVVNPNNPTGSFLKVDELTALRAVCRVRDLAVISDEVFADYGFAPDPARVPSLVGIDDVLTFCLSGLSKVVALPQMKLGWMAVRGPAALRREALARLEIIADTYLSVSAPAQLAADRWLGGRHAVQQAIRARVATNHATLAALRTSDAAWSVLHGEGGWYAVIRLPRTRTEDAWTLALLEEGGVLVQPGYFYDFDHEAHVVVSLITETDVFADGIARLANVVRRAA